MINVQGLAPQQNMRRKTGPDIKIKHADVEAHMAGKLLNQQTKPISLSSKYLRDIQKNYLIYLQILDTKWG